MSASIAFSKTSVGDDTDCEWVVCHFSRPEALPPGCRFVEVSQDCPEVKT